MLATSAASGCASTAPDRQIFDFAVPPPAATASIVEAKGKIELPRKQSAVALLGASQVGAGYAVQQDVLSNGRYSIYTFKTGHGTYSVTGDALAREHIQELVALDALKKRSRTGEFVHGVGSAVTGPVKAVYSTVTDPGGAATATYSNVKRKVAAVGRGVSKASEYITTFGNPEETQPDREDDGLLEGFIGSPEAKRRLAAALKVDPYTHFKPLAKELDKVASYSAVGKFGIDTAAGFVSGGAGTVITSLQRLDSFTERTLSMDPEEAAAANRERLKKLGIAKAATNKLLLNDKLTPTEKTQAVGYLNTLAGVQGLGELVSFIATSNTRHDAYAALQALSYLSGRPFGGDPVGNVEVIDRTPVLVMGDGKRIALLTSDDLAWTRGNADRLSTLGDALGNGSKGGPAKEMRISGNVSALAKRELQRRGWIVKDNAFNSALEPFTIEPATAKTKPLLAEVVQ